MPTRTATARWNGPVTDGAGTIALGSGSFSAPYSWQSRLEQESIDTHADVKLEKQVNGFAITRISLAIRRPCQRHRRQRTPTRRRRCGTQQPVSKALPAVDSIQLDAD
jgi:lipoyl-dependent peroxiredoxin